MLLLSPDGEDLLFLVGSITSKKEVAKSKHIQNKKQSSPDPKIQSNSKNLI